MKLDTSTLVLGAFAVVALLVAYYNSPELARSGLRSSWGTAQQAIPVLIAGFVLAELLIAAQGSVIDLAGNRVGLYGRFVPWEPGRTVAEMGRPIYVTKSSGYSPGSPFGNQRLGEKWPVGWPK